MGCGGSRLDQHDDARSAGTTAPFSLRCRIDDILRRRNKRMATGNTLSSKQLLNDNVRENAAYSPGDFPHNGGRKSASSQTPVNDVKVLESDNIEVKLVDQEKGRDVEDKKREREYDEGDEKEEVEEERGFSDWEGDEVVCGSPSFREYYVASIDNSVDSDDYSNGDAKTDGSTDEKKLCKEDKGEVAKLAKKERKKRSFKMVIPKRRQVAIKFRSIYYPISTTFSQDSHRILNKKSGQMK